jgi:diguanylate cyclase (GGDEF)-like protein/PAS domain S-box-containing protein
MGQVVNAMDWPQSLKGAGELALPKEEPAPLAWQDALVALADELKERRQAEAGLRENEARLRSLVEKAPGLVVVLDGDAVVRYANQATATLLGYDPRDLRDRPLIEIVHPDDADAIPALGEAVRELGPAPARDIRLRHRDGTWRTFEALGARLAEPWDQALLLEARDVEARRKVEQALRESELRYELAAKGAGDGLWDWNLVLDRVDYSAQWQAIAGCEDRRVGDRPDEWFDRIHPDELGAFKEALAAHLDGRTARFESEHRLRRPDGSYVWVLSRGRAVSDAEGKPCRMAGTLSNITDRKAAEQLLVHQAVHDALTGLPNRTAFLDRLERSLSRALRNKDYVFGLLYLDIDRFKLINDSLGHMSGDQLLIAMAQRLTTCLRPGDMVAHVGGDEFAILLDHIRGAMDATHVADRIQKEMAVPFRLGNQEVFATTSIGIALGGDEYERPDELLRDADTAMYRAKGQGSGRYQLFDPEMHARSLERLKLETDMRRALEREEFVVHYQPIVSLKTGGITGLEALVRWQHPERGLLAPAAFISVAEETGLIVPMSAWILREACGQAREWQLRFKRADPISLSMNLTPTTFGQANVVDVVRQVLSETGLPGSSLIVEITESMIMQDLQEVVAVLLDLKRLDLELHIDDFGTGYSSLSYLYSLPTDALKIDRSFVGLMGTRADDDVIVRAIVELAHNLGRYVIAEGIETAEQLERLRAMGCEYGQGYYFSRPLAAPAAEALLASRPSW